ncbi:putative aldouronate transport system permease protein [Paenibacillus castaneae]|uniref:ABC transporter permease n=1 Tax=Paenibacillus castaneae TaxID=474957 RepID=UPI001FB95BF4|nr:ABC transporter permease subunit [Paenibacillus castaneae]NIK78718.1 putative aldouronate transport system permease protein [Paenibacillus castaneae]
MAMNSLSGGTTVSTRPMRKLLERMWQARYLYLLVLPLLAYYVIFQYLPMYGVIIAFKSYNFAKGIIGSPWNDFEHFRYMFQLPQFWHVLKNTLVIAFGRLIIEFPFPIVFALLLHEIRSARWKRFYQTVFTFPHFLSWIIVSGILSNFLYDMGMLNQILQYLGFQKVSLLTDPSSFVGMLFTTNIWKEMGWGTIIYLAAMAGIDPTLYEAASIDGAGRLQKMRMITWPGIKSTVVVLFILAVGNTMGGAGFDQIFNLYNPGVYSVADILDTFIYRLTFYEGSDFGFTTAVGLFKSIVNCLLLFSANLLAKRMGERGIF